MAEQSPPIFVQRVHPGGFFWTVSRGDRLSHVVSFAAQTQRLALIANSERDAGEYAQRLTLSGVPVHLGTDASSGAAVKSFYADGSSTLVATHEYAVTQGPVRASMTIHLRTALSVRDYAKRLDALASAVHLSFVVPEDEKRAKSLLSHFEHDQGHGSADAATVDQLIDLTATDEVAMVSNVRRRFPLGR